MTKLDKDPEAFRALTAKLALGSLFLTPLAPSDAQDLLRHFGREDVTEFMDIDPIASTAEAEEIIDWAEDIRARAEGVRWVIRNEEGGEFLGTAGFNTIVRERGSRAEIAYDLYPDYWGRGIMRGVVQGLLAFADQELNLRRVEAMVTPGNLRSCHLLEACGFEMEGCLKQYGFWKGAYWDQLIFGRVNPTP